MLIAIWRGQLNDGLEQFLISIQKRPPEVFFMKRYSQKFRKIHMKTPVPQSLFK